MKRIIALIAAFVMVAALAAPAGAAVITEKSVNKSVDATASYVVEEEYTVTVPEALYVGDVLGSNIVVNANRNAGNTVVVTVSSENGFKLNGEADLAYELKADSVKISEGDVVLQTTGREAVAAVLVAVWAEGCSAPKAAGTYTDTLTFTVTAA